MNSPTNTQQPVAITKSSDYRSRYANHIQLTSTGTELRFLFCEVEIPFGGSPGTGITFTQQQARVEMHTAISVPLPLAKEIHRLLGEQMVMIERQQGLMKTAIER